MHIVDSYVKATEKGENTDNSIGGHMKRKRSYVNLIFHGMRHNKRYQDNDKITLMAYPLDEEAFGNIHGKFYESDVYEKCNDTKALEELTAQFPYQKPLKLSCQWLHKERLGRICEIQKNTYKIKFWEKELQGKLKGTFLRDGKELPVVGDYVTFEYNPLGNSMITSVCEKKSLLKRPDQSGHALGYVKNMQEQVMVSNFDYVFIVASLNDNYNFNRIARYVREVESLSDKVRVHTISALYSIGLDEVQDYLLPGNTIAILGSSGVGKSTLVNVLVGREIMKTSGIREGDAKGLHQESNKAAKMKSISKMRKAIKKIRKNKMINSI